MIISLMQQEYNYKFGGRIMDNLLNTDEFIEIKQKMELFLNQFQDQEAITPDQTMYLFNTIFNNEYLENHTYENSPYYKLDKNKFYLKKGFGIGIAVESGPGDIFGKQTSHNGVDIYIFSVLADHRIILFDESIKNHSINNYEKLFDLDFSVNRISSIEDDYTFQCLPATLKNNNEIIMRRYENLKNEAEYKHHSDAEDDAISPYGGLDVVIHSTEYYLYQSLLDHAEDTYFIENVMPLFAKDFPNYMNDKMNECEHALYIIDHKDQYYEIAKSKEEIANCTDHFYMIEQEKHELNEEKTELQKKLNQITNDLIHLNKKNYTIFDLLPGRKKEENIKLNRLINNNEETKKMIQTIDDKINDLNIKYEEFERIHDYNKFLIKKISSELEKDFKNFTLDPDFEYETYINGKYYMSESLDRLINYKDTYLSEYNELKQMNSFKNAGIDRSFEGFKLSDDELKAMSKDEMINYINMLHNNWSETNDKLEKEKNFNRQLQNEVDWYKHEYYSMCDLVENIDNQETSDTQINIEQ